MLTAAPDIPGIDKAVQLIAEGGVVACPTETVCGLAANPFSEAALGALCRVKERDETYPMLLVATDETQVDGLAREISLKA